MPTTYSECPDEIAALGRELMQRGNLEAIEAGVTICYLPSLQPAIAKANSPCAHTRPISA